MAISATDPPASTTPAAFKTWAQNVKNDLDALDSATYPNPLTLPAGQLQSTFSTAARGLVGSKIEAWLLDSAANEGGRGGFVVPTGWSTIDVYAWGANAGAGAGDIRLELAHYERADGEDASAAETTVGTTYTVAAQNIVKRYVVGSAIAVTPGEWSNLRCTRLGSHAADTLANDWALIGVEIRPS